MMKRTETGSGFEVYRGKGRRARRVARPRGGILFNLYMSWLRKTPGVRSPVREGPRRGMARDGL